jgi:nitrous oxide reductase accessory protein NosL
LSKSEDKQPDSTVQPDPAAADGEEELYEVPPRMTVGDTVGVVVALIALLVIGWLGYLWLTPGKSLADAFRFGGSSDPANTTMAEMQDGTAGDAAAATENRCEYCGMFADKSMSQVRATYADGVQKAFDSWGCLFNYTRDNDLELAAVSVVDHTSSLDDPEWLDAGNAAYLFGLEHVEGSMSPFVAAFADADTARAQMDELGGELLDYAGLRAKWSMPAGQSAEPGMHQDRGAGSAAAAAERSPGMAMEGMAEPGKGGTAKAEDRPAAMDQPHLHEHELRCEYCGMFADKSPSQVVGYWTDDSHTHHDCWDCLFNYAADSGLELDHALIKLYSSSLEQPEWIRAADATYLYGTSPIRGSMPPFIAAFADRGAAEQAMAELGGEIMNYRDLKANWE